MIARLRPTIGSRELFAAVKRRPNSVAEFERAFALSLGQRYALAFPYGRTALRLLLESFGFVGQEIICPAYTCIVVAHAIVASGNTPVFVDSRDEDFNMDLDLASAAVGPRTAAIVPTSLFGFPVDLDVLNAFASSHPDLRVVQDCAHSFGAEWRGQPVQRAGDAAVYGLNVSKIITAIFGGVVATDSGEVFESLREKRERMLVSGGLGKELRRALYLGGAWGAFLPPVYRLVDELVRRGVLGRFTDYYDEHVIDMPRDHLTQMANVEARVGLVQAGRYEEIVAHRRRSAAIYNEVLADARGVRLPPAEPGATYSHYVVRTQRAEFVMKELQAAGVQAGRLVDYVVPDLAAYAGARFLDRGVARTFPPLVLNLPVHAGVDSHRAESIGRIVAAAAAP